MTVPYRLVIRLLLALLGHGRGHYFRANPFKRKGLVEFVYAVNQRRQVLALVPKLSRHG